jgi:hypothetical protein
MSEATSQAKEQRFANVTALCRQLEEMTVRAKATRAAADQPMSVQGPVLVIRGK